MPVYFIIFIIVSILIAIAKGYYCRSVNEDLNKCYAVKQQNEAEYLYQESVREHERLSQAFAEDLLKDLPNKYRQEGKSEEEIKKYTDINITWIRFEINSYDLTTAYTSDKPSDKSQRIHDAWMTYYRKNAKLAWLYEDRRAKSIKESYKQQEAEYRKFQQIHPDDQEQLTRMQQELEQRRLFMEQQMRETQITMEAQHEFIKASTGIEFGGYNPDLNLNPSMQQMVDPMNPTPSTPDLSSMPVPMSMQDFGNNNTFGNGF